jgi:benzoate membrane transport protein
LELVVPLAITVLFVQNNQGIALLESAGHRPPVNAITTFCGLGSLVAGVVGSVPTCLTGPVNAIISEDEDREGHYTAGIIVALLLAAFGIMAPLFTSLILAAPEAFIATLGGIALLKVLQGAFKTAFEGRLSMGGLIAFVVTVSDVSFANIGAPFWGLVLGVLVSWAVETAEMRSAPHRE